ncbi:hypothetical protein [Musicola paradisiaca]|uniref:Uncharacterized protein n=1 Tax=Musicola paradisiaca (strain Ech703) TaxID=579405 RepID=C6C3B7_MUSP7|nr:hypothetical protein [Musicola paradisiaca]ACS87215.1 conserved hypothetical protein [Musicola paradisiaca Ech703]
MKLNMSLVFLSFAAADASAFQARIAPVEPNGAVILAQAENAFRYGHGVKTATPGLCDAVSVSGCNCPFCTQLRSLGR